jgi:hypothetical protein
VRAAALIVCAAACGPRAAPGPAPGSTHAHAWGEPSTTRSAPRPFLDQPGLTQITVATVSGNEVGSVTATRTQIVRAGRVVCELDGGSTGAEHTHRWRTHTAVLPRGRDPLRFEVLSSQWSNDGLRNLDSCERYELPTNGSCRLLLRRTCAATCAPDVSIAQRAGSGRVVVTATGDGEPLPSVMVAPTQGGEASFTDEHGAVTFEAGATRGLWISTGPGNAMVSIDPKPDQDTVLTITATGCSCCASPSP